MTFKAFDYSLRKFSNKTSKFRDEGMFDLTNYIIEHKEKSVIVAHNGHIGCFNDRMGFYLKEHFEKKYVTLGFLFYEGKYAAMDTNELEEFNFKADIATYESLFNQIPYNVFFVDLKKLKENKKLIKKISPRGFYQLGATSQFSVKSFDIINLEEKFDYIIFIKKISPTQF
jgi:erythromycin esterase-like protein